MSLHVDEKNPYNYANYLNRQAIEASKKEDIHIPVPVKTEGTSFSKHMNLINRYFKPVTLQGSGYTAAELHSKAQCFIKETYYVNKLENIDVYIQESNNLAFKVQSVKGRTNNDQFGNFSSNEFVIIERYKFGTREDAEECRNVMAAIANNTEHMTTNLDAKALCNALTAILAAKPTNVYAAILPNDPVYCGTYTKNSSIYVDLPRIITLEQLKECDRLYVNNLNVVLSLNPLVYEVPHPKSIEASRSNHRRETDNVPESNYRLLIELVDNDHHIKNKYAYILGELVKLSPVEDPSRPNGLYINETINGTRINKEKNYYTFEELEERGLYATLEEAMTNGKPELLLEKIRFEKAHAEAKYARTYSENRITDDELRQNAERLKLQNQIDELKTQQLINEQKQEHEAKMLKFKEEAEKLNKEHEAKMIKLKEEAEKEKRESEKEKQKIERTNNILKVIGGIATTIVTSLLLYEKYIKNKS